MKGKTQRKSCTYILLILCLFFQSCFPNNSSDSQSSGYKFVLLVPRIDSVWYQNTIKGFLDTCEEYGAEGTVLNSQLDENLIILNLSQALSQEVDGVALMSPKSHSGWAIMSRALTSNVPIISIDENIIDSQGRQLTPYIGINDREAGSLAGQWASKSITDHLWLINQDISLGIAVLTYEELNGMKERIESFYDTLTENLPNLSEDSIFYSDCNNGSAVNGLLAMQQLLANHPEITHWLVFGATADSVIGAVRGLEQLGLAKNAIACGIDGGLGFNEFSKERETSYRALIYVDTYQQGKEAAKALYNYSRYKTPIPVATYTKIFLITREDWVNRTGEL